MSERVTISEDLDLRLRDDRLREAVHNVLAAPPSRRKTFVSEFLSSFADLCQSRYAVGVGSRSDALRIAMSALDVRGGSEVITTSIGSAVTAAAILQLGATPRFIDVAANIVAMDPMRLEPAINDRTAAILVSHQNEIADMDAIMEIACEAGIPVIEDASSVAGLTHDGQSLGTIADIGCFGFDMNARLHATGEAGALVTNSGELAIRLAELLGPLPPLSHDTRGIAWGSSFDSMQAAMLSVHLDYLHEAQHKLSDSNGITLLHEASAFADRCVADDLKNSRRLYHR